MDSVNNNIKFYKKGYSGNPTGRPKGAKNRKTIVRQLLDSIDDEGITNTEIIIKALLKEAKEGNVRAFNVLMDSAFGKVTSQVETAHSFIKMDMIEVGIS